MGKIHLNLQRLVFNKHVLWFETNSFKQMVGQLAVNMYLITFFTPTLTHSASW